MKNRPNILFILILLLVSNVLIEAQYIGKRWAIVQDLEDKTVYLDTTSIRPFEKQISLWSLIVYREPQNIEPLSKKVSHVKSQYLINNITKRYSVIGALYYDDRGRIIGESSTPRPVGGRDNFSLPIHENTSLEVLLLKAQNFIGTGNLDSSTDETVTSPDNVAFDASLYEEVNEMLSGDTETDEFQPISDETSIPDTVSDEEINSSSQSAQLGLKPYINSDIVVLKDVSGNEPIKSEDNSGTEDEIEYEPPSNLEDTSSTPNSNKSIPYDFENESNVSNVIFTDGNLFCFQVSSWRRKEIAESEAEKLRSSGHNAFVVEAYIPSKRGTWYRVRIGYFNSLQETRDYQRKL